MAEAKNSRGDAIIVDDQPTEAKHPAASDLKQDDRQPAVVGDAESNDPPVRTDRPDVPVVQRLGVGMGDHVTPDPEQFDEYGRFRVNDEDGPRVDALLADEKENKERQKASDAAAKADAPPKGR
jgi:hypothetical protein